MIQSEERVRWDERARLAALDSYSILDTPTEADFDDIVRLAADAFDAPIAVVNLIAKGRQWFKAEVGIGARELPLDVSICAHAILQENTMVVPDTTKDERFINNPLVMAADGLRFYAGALLKTPDGLPLGTVCVLDRKPRIEGITPHQRLTLEVLAKQVMTQLEYRRIIAIHEKQSLELHAEISERRAAQEAQRDSANRYQSLFNSLDAGFCVVEVAFNHSGKPTDYKFVEVNKAFATQTGIPNATGKWMRDIAKDHEEYWFEVYGKVALTGEAARFEHRAKSLDGRWFDVHAFRIGALGKHQVAILFQDISDQKKAAQLLQLMNDELGHRIKNSMSLVQAIASQTLRNVTDKAAVTSFNQRIVALSQAHDVLLQQSWSSAGMREVVAGALAAHSQADRFNISGPVVDLDPKAALSLSMLLHELATNAVKYGSLSVRAGTVEIAWSLLDSHLTLRWEEHGGPAATEPVRTGLGTRLINLGLVGTGEVTKSYTDAGFMVEFRAPLNLIQQASPPHAN